MNKKCIGCGITLQNTDANLIGYTTDLKNPYCRRCFRLKNYGEKPQEDYIDNNKLLTKINKKKGIVFYLIDYLNINSETISYFKKITLPKALIINKCDTLRQEIKFSKIKLWLKEVYNIEEDIFFSSAKTNYLNINLFKYITALGFNNCYIMGITNAGKSTFLNNILKENHLNKEIVVSNMANTTLDFIKFKINDIYIYDTPGFIYNSLSSSLITKEIKPLTYNLTKPLTIKLLSNYFYFPTPNKITIYLSTPKIEKEYKSYSGYAYKIPKNHSLVFPGGFINIKEACTVYSSLPNLEIRKDISEV